MLGDLVPLVGIIMASSDAAIMRPCMEQLDAWGIPYEVKTESASRVPNVGQRWLQSAHKRGVRVIIVAAGKLAYLSGVAAASTPLPVLTVATTSRVFASPNELENMLRLPGCSRAAAFVSGGPRSAAVLAAQIIAASDPDLQGRLFG